MRLERPRIEPLPEAEWSEEQRKLIQPMKDRWGFVFNVLQTMIRNMPLFLAWSPLGTHLMDTSALSPRHRELLILRVAWRTRSEYEWGQHVVMSQSVGLSPEDFERIKSGPDAEGWEVFDATLLRATDELLDDTMLSDEVWSALANRLSDEQMTDLIFTVGHYKMLAMALNSLGVQRDPNVPGFSD